jgi:hypothetical protein
VFGDADGVFVLLCMFCVGIRLVIDLVYVCLVFLFRVLLFFILFILFINLWARPGGRAH